VQNRFEIFMNYYTLFLFYLKHRSWHSCSVFNSNYRKTSVEYSCFGLKFVINLSAMCTSELWLRTMIFNNLNVHITVSDSKSSIIINRTLTWFILEGSYCYCFHCYAVKSRIFNTYNIIILYYVRVFKKVLFVFIY